MIHHSTASRIVQIVPFQDTITYYDRTGTDTFTSYTSLGHRKKTKKERTDDKEQLLATTEVVWQIIAANLPVTPQKDDYLVDENNVSWYVTEVVGQFNGAVWNLMTRQGV
jgi:hypothetical protein